MTKNLNNIISSLLFLSVSLFSSIGIVMPVQAQSGKAIVEVMTEPAISGTVRFSGTPDGEVSLPSGAIFATGLTPGSYQSSVSYVEPALLAANYSLTSISCDDDSSASPSIGDVASGRATFNLDNSETVTCVFIYTKDDVDNGPGDDGGDDGDGDDGGNDDGDNDGDDDLVSCICPKEGSWRVSNLPGKMVCTGVMSMTVPLAPSRDTGVIEKSNSCRTLTASGLSEDEATIEFNRTANCNYIGTVGGSHEGIPMEIDFTLNVADESSMSGKLHSVVSQQGMTCTMSRNYTMNAVD
ncbi:prealbumin-like fold domain-containing protein [Marinicella litoralis]|uniref:Uncharacterized protein n=1 Tax=Marinicella litoralis TaxID=644220 RepID=A0A4R6XYT4_9GAMM|nr:hypothetical protein [Marinicella litoralis]TDR23484.1 hypothetical protein C8D91_0346 [Marinicella litoralis]